MLSVLTGSILPVFATPALGYLLGRLGQVSRDEAAGVNRVAFLVLQPALVFPLVAALDFSVLRFDLLGVYAACEALGFAITYLL